jgi:hypothetical protein
VPVDDLGVALFAGLLHTYWRETQNLECALTHTRAAFLSGNWPETTVTLVCEMLAAHLQQMIFRYIAIDDSAESSLRHNLRNQLNTCVCLACNKPAQVKQIQLTKRLIQWECAASPPIGEIVHTTSLIATQLITRRRELPFRYVAIFAVGCG